MAEINNHSLSALSLECLDHILSFAIPNGALSLIFTGDKHLVHKVRRTRRLSICWNKSGYADWSAVKPLVCSFSKLESLLVTTCLPSLLSQGPLNAGIFPSSLQRLTLRYSGSAALLSPVHAPILLTPLVLLEHFCIHDQSDVAWVNSASLSHFPSSLRSLRIIASLNLSDSTAVTISLSDLVHLPSGLETLHLHSHDAVAPPDASIALPAHLASLTDLSICVSADLELPVGAAHFLKRLAFSGSGIRIGEETNVFLAGKLGAHFPRLESLKCASFKLRDWNQLRDFPHTLVEMSISIDSILLAPVHSRTVELLNEDASHGPNGDALFAAPKNFRIFGHYEDMFFPQPIPAQIMQHFDTISKHQRSLVIHPQPPSTFAPTNMFRLSRASEMSLRTVKPLYALTELKIHQNFTVDMLHQIPPSLETLNISVNESAALRGIASRAPHLKSLHLQLTESRSERSFLFDASTVPTTLTSLTIWSWTDNFTVSLENHPHLTKIGLHNVKLLAVLPQLPRHLLHFTASLSNLINLNNLDEALQLYRMRTFLPMLKELELERYDPDMNGSYDSFLQLLLPDAPPRFTFKHFLTLPWQVQRLYAYRYLHNRASRVWTQEDLFAACEHFMLACFPRSLSELRLPRGYKKSSNSNRKSLLVKRHLLTAVKYQLPLLGLLFHSVELPTSNRYLPYLPPRLSSLRIGYENMVELCAGSMMRNATGFTGEDFADPAPERALNWFAEPLYHVLNASSWLLIILFGAFKGRQNRLLQGYMLVNIIGSTTFAALLTRRIWRSGLVLPNPKTMVKSIFTHEFLFGVLITFAYHLMLCASADATPENFVSRFLIKTSQVFLFVTRNYLLQR